MSRTYEQLSTAKTPTLDLSTATADEAANILKASEGSVPFLKFRNGQYFVGEVDVPLGREFLAYCRDWVHGWVKFVDGKLVERRLGRVADGFVPPKREELDDPHLADTPADPWSFQHYLPLENVETGDRYLFVTSTSGGDIAVKAVCNKYGRNVTRGLPTVELAVGQLKSKEYGNRPRPDFPIVRWENDGATAVTPSLSAELNDTIPF